MKESSYDDACNDRDRALGQNMYVMTLLELH
jgi:hypothetical protein